jgi:hypothetical protein
MVLEVMNDIEAAYKQGVEAGIAESREFMRWVRQTVHQAYHEGTIEECPKNLCKAISRYLEDTTAHVHDRPFTEALAKKGT